MARQKEYLEKLSRWLDRRELSRMESHLLARQLDRVAYSLSEDNRPKLPLFEDSDGLILHRRKEEYLEKETKQLVDYYSKYKTIMLIITLIIAICFLIYVVYIYLAVDNNYLTFLGNSTG